MIKADVIIPRLLSDLIFERLLMSEVNYSNKWYVMISVCFGVFLATIDSSIVNISLPTLVTALESNFATVQWVVLAYLLTITALLLGVGRLSDIIGKKVLYIAGFFVFLLGSLFCGLSQSAGLLIASRVLQAIGASFLMALGPALLAEGFPPEERGRALGISGLSVSLGIILGPTLGGLILGHLSWHWIFFVNLPVGLIGIPIAIRSLPSSSRRNRERFDLFGSVLLLIALSSLLFCLTFTQSLGIYSPVTIGLFVLFLLFIGIFIKVELSTKQPVVDLSLFKNMLFSVNLITGFLTFVASAGTIFLIPFYLQNVLNYDPQVAGLLLAVFPITLGIVGPLSGWLSDRFGFRLLTVVGLAILSFGYFGMRQLSVSTTWQGFVLALFPIGIGMGIFQSPNNSAILGTAASHRLGVVSGLLAITRTLGQTTGIAIIGAFWTSMVFQQTGNIGGDATNAPASAQVVGMHFVFIFLGIVLFAGMCLSVFAWIRERQTSAAVISEVLSDQS
jgi:EmrB/QacA subfamily drug resistance transporter